MGQHILVVKDIVSSIDPLGLSLALVSGRGISLCCRVTLPLEETDYLIRKYSLMSLLGGLRSK